MKKLLILGVNTRPIVNSALKLDFEVYSSSYYATYDFNKPFNEVHILNQKSGVSCGNFEEKFSPEKLLDISRDFLDIVDYIVLGAGISASDFKGSFRKYRGKIIGNKNIENIEDKYRFYNKVKNKFLTPETFKIVDIDEVDEIIKNDINKQYILKPCKGSGGYGVNLINYDSFNQFKDKIKDDENFNYVNDEKEKSPKWILQEQIKGINISSSVLSTNHKAKTLINSRLLTLNDYNKENSYIYNGNIIPLDFKSLNILNNYTIPHDEIGVENLNEDMSLLSEELIKYLKLIGSNGVDMILSENSENKNILDNDIYVIEVNPRIQGTYECVEELLKINLLNAHIKACHGEIIDIPSFKGYCMKKILYSENNIKIGKFNSYNLYDLPYPNVIIEKEQPVLTIINKNKNLKKLMKNIEETEKNVKNSIL